MKKTPYPYFLEIIECYNNPKSFFDVPLTGEEIEDKKSSIKEGLERLREE